MLMEGLSTSTDICFYVHLVEFTGQVAYWRIQRDIYIQDDHYIQFLANVGPGTNNYRTTCASSTYMFGKPLAYQSATGAFLLKSILLISSKGGPTSR